MAGQIRVGVLTALVITGLGVPVGLLWAAIAPRTAYVIMDGKAYLADPETQTLIAADGWFAVLTAAAGVLCGLAGYLLAGRLGELGLLGGVTAGAGAAALVAWQVGQALARTDGRHPAGTGSGGATATLDLRAMGVIVAWPLVAAAAFALLEALDPLRRESAGRQPAGDGGGARAGQPDQVDRGELDLQAAPTGRDVDRREP